MRVTAVAVDFAQKAKNNVQSNTCGEKTLRPAGFIKKDRVLRKKFYVLRPMTMETRCSKVILPNYSRKKPAEDTLVPPLWGTREKKKMIVLKKNAAWGTREKNVCFSRNICSRCCTRRNMRFHVEN